MRPAGEAAAAMALTVNLSTARWEIQVSVLTQLAIRPVWLRWSRPGDRGFLAKFLFFAVRYGAGAP